MKTTRRSDGIVGESSGEEREKKESEKEVAVSRWEVAQRIVVVEVELSIC